MQYCRICIPKQYDLHHHNVTDETNCHKFGHTEAAVPTLPTKNSLLSDPSVISADENDA